MNEQISDGLIIAISGYVIVFLALLGLYLVFLSIPKIMRIRVRTKMQKKGEKFDETECITGEMNAAISSAIYLYLNEIHDEEEGELTIKKISKRYSPWSSKIYHINILNRKSW